MLWRKVGPGLSAGRVQSAATRLVVDRERERLAFVPAGYWDVSARFAPETGQDFAARLARLDGRRIATGRDFDDRGRLKGEAAAARRRVRSRPRRGDRAGAAAGHRALDRVEALHASPRRAVHDLHAAAGGGPQAALLARSRRCPSRRGCTRTATSPTCGPTRRRCRRRRSRPPGRRPRGSSAPRPCPTRPAPTPAARRTRRRPTRRSARPVTPSAPRTSCAAPSAPTICGSTSSSGGARSPRRWSTPRGSTATVVVGVTAGGRNAEFSASGTVITVRGFLLAYEEGRDEERNADCRRRREAAAARRRVRR